MTIITEALKYSAAGDELHGHLAYDDAISGERPGVLIIHEWWGLNDYMRERAAQIAGLGYAPSHSTCTVKERLAAVPMKRAR